MREVSNPGPPGSGQSFLVSGPGSKVYLSWIEPAGNGSHRLQYATKDGDSWRVLGPAGEGRNWFVNWADYPTFLPLANGALAAHWLEKASDSKYSYGIKLAQSSGAGWRISFAPKVQQADQYTGFVALVALARGLGAAYLAPGMGGGEEDKSLRFVKLSAEGAIESDELLDPDVCTCCQTAAALTEEGPIVAYRDHEAGEIRDIAVVSLRNGKWTSPKPINRDGWRINACPVNGPAIAASGKRVALTWYTAAENKPRVYAAFSQDSGVSFGAPVRIDEGLPLGRVALVALPDGEAVVSWIEKRADGGAEIRVRRASAGGRRSASQIVTAVDAGRKTGFPKMVVSGRERLMVTWTADRIRTVEIDMPRR